MRQKEKDTTDKKTTKANSQNKDDVLSKVNDATSIIENYEKSIKNTQKEIAKKKEEVEETENIHGCSNYCVICSSHWCQLRSFFLH